jgi:signal transduction histidine kinase
MNNQKDKSEQPEAFCLDDFMDEMYTYVEHELKIRGRENVGIEIFDFTHFKKCWAHIDREKLRQIFEILLSYAAKNTDRGYIFFGFHTSASGDNINFIVDDTSVGIYNHKDLDLAIAKGLVETMGGKFKIEATVEAGISIRFNIKCEPFEGN